MNYSSLFEYCIYVVANILFYRALVTTYRLRHKDDEDEEENAE